MKNRERAGLNCKKSQVAFRCHNPFSDSRRRTRTVTPNDQNTACSIRVFDSESRISISGTAADGVVQDWQLQVGKFPIHQFSDDITAAGDQLIGGAQYLPRSSAGSRTGPPAPVRGRNEPAGTGEPDGEIIGSF